MRATAAWEQLLRVIEQHGQNLQYLLAVHTSTCAQPGKAEALVPSLEAAGFRQAHVTGSGAWTVSLDLPALYAPGDAAAFHLTVEGVSKKAVVREACQVCLAFMLVVAPRKLVLHLNALAHREASKQALIDAGRAVQTELGPPVSGTYRDRFHGDETPRIDRATNPGGRRRRRGHDVVPDDDRALQALRCLPVGPLWDMSGLPRWYCDELAGCVMPGGLRDLLRRFPQYFELVEPHQFRVIAPWNAPAAAPPASGPTAPAAAPAAGQEVCARCGRASSHHMHTSIWCTWCHRPVCEWHHMLMPPSQDGIPTSGRNPVLKAMVSSMKRRMCVTSRHSSWPQHGHRFRGRGLQAAEPVSGLPCT